MPAWPRPCRLAASHQYSLEFVTMTELRAHASDPA